MISSFRGTSLLTAFAAASIFFCMAARAEDMPQKPADHSASYYHYGLAKLYEEEATTTGRQDLATQAIEQYKLALDADPNSRMLQDGLANLYFKLGRVREAVAAAQSQVSKHPDDPDAHVLLGRVYLRSLGDGQGPQSTEMLQLAIAEYEKIAALKPDDIETHLLLGQLYGLNHDSVKAEAQFKAAQGIDSDSEEVVLSMARLYSEQGDLKRAAKTIADVPEEDRTSRMNFALAGIYDQLNQPKDAIAAYKATLAGDPDNTDAKRGLANALMHAGQADAAGKLFGEIVGSDPQDAESLIREADIQRQQGKYEQALATLKKAAVLAPDNLELKYNEALLFDALGRLDDAVSTLKSILAATTPADGKYSEGDKNNRVLFLERLGIVYREQGKTAESADAFKQIMALGGEAQVRGADGLIDTYRDAHNWNAARDAAAEAAKALPKNHDIQLAYARQLADSGKVDDALKIAQAQLTGTPDDREIWFTIADIDHRARRWNETAEALNKVETLSTKKEDKVFLYYYRGSIAEQRKMYDEAESDFKKGLALDPDSGSIQNDYGYMLAERGIRLDEAVAMLKKAVAYDPQNGAFLDSLAWAYYKQGQYVIAEDYERKAVLRSRTDPSVLDHMGEIYAKNGKLQMAVVEWQKSLDEYSTSLPPEADPVDVAKVQRKLEGARVRLAHSSAPATK